MLVGVDFMVLLIVVVDAWLVGFVQWYWWVDYLEVVEYDVYDGDVGIDYFIGDLCDVGCGFGMVFIAVVIDEIRWYQFDVVFLVSVDVINVAFWCVLEKNGFELVDECNILSEFEVLLVLYWFV